MSVAPESDGAAERDGASAAASPDADALAAPADLTVQLDRLRERKAGIAAAHRGRPDPHTLENALSGLQAAWEAGIQLMEVDVATTADGALVLLHDDRLERTTTGEGPVSAATLAQVRACRLKDRHGNPLEETVPTLAEALRWARTRGAWLQLDIKPRTRVEAVLQTVDAEQMAGQVIIVTYRLSDALRVHRLDPRVMVSTPIRSVRDLRDLQRRGFDLSRLIAWTGTQKPSPSLWEALRRHGVEAAFGTNGRARVRLDDLYLADGDPAEYSDLVRQGVTVIASDRAGIVQQAISHSRNSNTKDTP
ncbi:glycerophosphodiester phosphodiesterase family protein [Pedomonas sp. V897]|uniref:glycerophosphodiester phosphodiesterase family protein n=1 Tax=Pedomonas sp. V897 TaxID=3446482 RepID=UPI003EE14185